MSRQFPCLDTFIIPGPFKLLRVCSILIFTDKETGYRLMTIQSSNFWLGQVQLVSCHLYGCSIRFTQHRGATTGRSFTWIFMIVGLFPAIGHELRQCRDNVWFAFLSLVPEEGTRTLMRWRWDSDTLLAIISYLSLQSSPRSSLKRQHRQNIKYYLLSLSR